jgi:rhodanese-related sulfurtransferase
LKNPIANTLLTLMFTVAASTALAQGAPASGAGAAKPPASKTHELSNAEFDALVAKPKKLLIIDLRRPDELTKIGGFPVYLSIQISDLENRLDWIPKDRTIVTVSNHAVRSGKAADLLTSKGFKVAGTVGAQTYEERGGQLTKITPPPPRTAASTPPPADAK